MTKRVFIVHGWDSNPKTSWYPWLKKALERKGFKVIVPEMPNTSEPEINTWISHLKKIVRALDEDTYFIGHSIGCQTIMRFLEKEDYNGKIGKVIFVAGWFKLDHLENEEVETIANPWINTPIDFNKIKQKLSSLTVFLSSNEPYNYIEENKITFGEKLKAKVLILENKGHFTEEDSVKEVPEFLKEIQYDLQTNCIIIHGCFSNVEEAMNPETRTYDKYWIPRTKKILAKDIETETPFMPSPREPDYEKFKRTFEKYYINENTILIGHSCGCAFLVRWLGETKMKIFKLILVAPENFR